MKNGLAQKTKSEKPPELLKKTDSSEKVINLISNENDRNPSKASQKPVGVDS